MAEGEGDGRGIKERHYTRAVVYSAKCNKQLGAAICRVTYARRCSGGRLDIRVTGYKIHHRRFNE